MHRLLFSHQPGLLEGFGRPKMLNVFAAASCPLPIARKARVDALLISKSFPDLLEELKGIWMRLQFAFVQTKPNLTPWPLRSSSSSQNTGHWQNLHTSDLSIAPFSKFISTTMLFLFSVRSSESISEQSFRAETLAFNSSSSSHFTWSNHDPLSDCASVVFLCSEILSVVFLCFFRFRVLVQGQSDFRFIGFIFHRCFDDCRE